MRVGKVTGRNNRRKKIYWRLLTIKT